MNSPTETPQAKAIRPTKKQKELMSYIEDFIDEHGYSPSYREIMAGTGHNSVATVSLHVNNLIKRGHLRKRDRSARSLEIIKPRNAQQPAAVVPKQLKVAEEKWLIDKIEIFFKEVERAPAMAEQELDKLYVLIGALKVLGLEGAAQSFLPRLSELKKRHEDNQYAV